MTTELQALALLNSVGALALLGWALINERRITRLETLEEARYGKKA